MVGSSDDEIEDKAEDVSAGNERPAPTKAVVILLDSMLANQNDEALQLRAILSLLRMSLNNSERKLVGDSGCIQPVIADLKLFPDNDEIIYNGCKLLANIAFNCDENKHRIRQCNGIDIVINIMKERKEDEELQIHASLVLRNMTHLCQKNQLRVSAIGGIRVLSCVLKQFLWNKKIQINAISAVGNIANVSMDSQMCIRESECIEAILSAMSQHASSRTLQDHALVAITSICRDNEKNQQRFGGKGGIKLIASALESFGEHSNFLVRASGAVRVLCLNGNNREAVGESGVLSFLLKALKDGLNSWENYGDFVAVLKAISNAIFSPAGNREILIAEEGIETVMSCMWERKKDSEIVEGGLRVFRNIVDGGGERCKRLGNSNVFSFAVEVMVGDKQNAGICEHTLALLLRTVLLPYNEGWIGMEASALKKIVEEQVEIHDSVIPIQKLGQKVLTSFWTDTEISPAAPLVKLKSKEVFNMIRRLGSHA